MVQDNTDKTYFTIISGLVIAVCVMAGYIMKYSDESVEQCMLMAEYSFNVSQQCKVCEYMWNITDRCQMYNVTPKDAFVNGLYFYEHKYYCVWVEGRTLEMINQTEVHEQCHALVHNQTEHFCGAFIEVRYE